MKPDKFMEIIRGIQEREIKVLDDREGKYAINSDRLYNFRAIAEYRKKNMIAVAYDNVLKQFTALNIMVMGLEQTGLKPKLEDLQELVQDIRNYMAIIECLWLDQYEYEWKSPVEKKDAV